LESSAISTRGLRFELWGCRLFAERSEQMSDSDGALVAPELVLLQVFAGNRFGRELVVLGGEAWSVALEKP